MKRFLLIEAQQLRYLDMTGAYGVMLPLDVAQPLGLIQLAAVIRKRDISAEVRILDLRLLENDYRDLPSLIKSFNPHFVGFRTVSRDGPFMYEMVNLVRDLVPGALRVGGGPHVTAVKERIMDEAPFDYAIYGEGERALAELLDRLEEERDPRTTRGLIYRDERGNTVVNEPAELMPDLDDLPPPAWDLLDHERYFDLNYFPIIPAHLNACRELVSIFTSRGCPYGCAFCHSIFGKRFRGRSAEKVVEEMEQLYNSFHMRQFDIRDDIFNLDRERAHRICDLIIEKCLPIRISFPNGVRGDIMDEELVVKLKAAGMFSCTYALETASPRLQRMIKKNIDLERLRDIIRFTSSQDIITKVFVMLGFPTETREELALTVDYALDPAIDFIIAHTVNPFEGTELADMARSKGFNPHELMKRYDYLAVNFSVAEVDADELRDIKNDLFVRFFTAERTAEADRKLRLHAL
jgi:anaerobic magnesium-protoporphyrin IX monomethyl ester cyclase